LHWFAPAARLADTASHNASAEAFLTLAHADKLGTPVYMQVQQMFAQRFEQTKAPESKKPYWKPPRANAAGPGHRLEQAQAGWSSSTPATSANPNLDRVLPVATGQESPGKNAAADQQSAQMTQAKLESAVPVVNKLLDDMTNELTRTPQPAKKK
jgi:hypothetical protein